MKKKYSLFYERYFYKFIPSKKTELLFDQTTTSQMKKFFKRLIIILVIGFIAGITTSCAVFQEQSHAQKPGTFKHTSPLPKKWVIDNGYKPIAK